MSADVQSIKLAIPEGFFAALDWKALRVQGDDQEKFLSGLLTNTIKGMSTGDNNRTLALTVKGRIIAESLVVRTEDGFQLWVDQDAQADLWQHLDHYHVIEDVTFDWSDDTAYLLGGRDLTSHLAAWGLTCPEEGKGIAWEISEVGTLWATRPVHPTGGPLLMVWGSPETMESYKKKLQERGWSDQTKDVEALFFSVSWYKNKGELKDLLIHEASLEESHVNFKKGCFIGQEVVARTHWRGKANKGLFLLVSETPLPAEIQEGSPILNQDQKEVGTLRRRHPLLQGQEGFRALLRLKSVTDQDALHVVAEDGKSYPLHRVDVHLT
ncbi:MAG: hypothetical protein H6728_09390 [Myxococcales bacterium]|nr:hypothetical protein [Myxococcales bacterium]MCB9643275.1 hypothetical protein [Myxococcales bacterium]